MQRNVGKNNLNGNEKTISQSLNLTVDLRKILCAMKACKLPEIAKKKKKLPMRGQRRH